MPYGFSVDVLTGVIDFPSLPDSTEPQIPANSRRGAVFNGSAMDAQDAIWYEDDQQVILSDSAQPSSNPSRSNIILHHSQHCTADNSSEWIASRR